MAIRLSEKYLQQIEACVDTIQVDNWIEVFETEAFRELRESVKKIHGTYLTDGDAGHLILSRLVEVFVGEPGPRGGAIVWEENSDLREKLIDSLRDDIQSLPWTVQVNFPLPRFNRFGDFEIKICDSLSLQTRLAPVSPMLEGLNPLIGLVRNQGHAWLCVTVNGYIDSLHESAAVSSAITQAKRCLYFFGGFAAASPWDVLQAEAFANGPRGSQAIRLPHSLERYFGGLAPVESRLAIYDHSEGKGLLGGAFRPANTDDERCMALRDNLGVAQSFFERREHEDFDAIAAAIEWYIDSITADNQTFAYIAACIGLEALLGYGDSTERMDAMSSRLSDRYGFLLGTGRKQRDRLAEEFKQMLSLRGKLVHARSKRLTAGEQQQLHQVQNMLSKVIGKEISVFIRQ
ncbi:hypothetical protein [Bordetella petrii]|uniref:hypothetical protein n=1 Tax=Bordetella petrii TaxID=94624 RepID=UPI0037327980